MSSEPTQTIQPAVVPATPQIETIKTIQDTQIKKVVPVSKSTRECNENYSGCLNPNASDYDCSGGSGNGPYYTGTVQVLGYDEYDLDRDGDGWGCE
ncbi:hypothetical protein ESA94_18315 [Lacibacter luteus]|uniref:Excalibur calcium-binding domain-containing protein n=1 Tax=Lacibacter luteus TaxID=2508719 RepID=A0A4Q1CFB4_9BACT|nr:hypothetical protein ESA94_18315 [Lacibacter luteus]